MNELPKIIGLTAKKQSGKTTVANMLRSLSGAHFTSMSFAAPIKRAIHAIGLTTEEAEQKESYIPRFNASPRKLWQTLGTEWGRTLHPAFWVNIARPEAAKLVDNGYIVIFDDVRFDNEAKMIHELGGEVWEIIRPSQTEQIDAHSSEQGISEHLVDLRIYNDGDEARLRSKIARIVRGEAHEVLA